MKRIGYLLITVGFLAGALTAVVDELNVRWLHFVAALAAGVVGVVMVRLDEHRHASSEHKVAANMQNIETSLGNIVENMTNLNAQKESINTYDVRHRIDELFSDDLNTFVEARESLTQAHGLQAYADVMSHFAAGERYLNRVWSASADGYIDEVNAYIDKAQNQFAATLRTIRQLDKANTKN